jgi:hypothetical protein
VVLLCATKFLVVCPLVLVALNNQPRLLQRLPKPPHLLLLLPVAVLPLVAAVVVLALPNPIKLINS